MDSISTINLRAGSLLLAQPFMHDAYFNRTVIYICEKAQGGTIGYILNKPMKTRLHELIDDFPYFDADVHFGGPVGSDSLHYLHSEGDLVANSIEVSEGVFWGGDYEMVKDLIRSDQLNKNNIHFFIGYAGWTSGQLEAELLSGSWIQASVRADHVFNTSPYKLWQSIMKEKGEPYAILSEMPNGSLHN